MSKYYNPKRTRNVFEPSDTEPYQLSRSKLELFIDCPRCFYLDRRLGVGRPPGYPFAINSAIDHLLKKEFDIHRASGEQHPIQKQYGIDAWPVAHLELDTWRENFKGVRFYHKEANLVITGAIDDLWINSKNEYIVVDYKATATEEQITELTKDHHEGYKRQMEIYQWLLRANGLTVSNTGYFVYANGRTDVDAFDGRVEFDVTLIPYEGDDSWIEKTIIDAHKCLMGDSIPDCNPDCDYCAYTQAVKDTENLRPEPSWNIKQHKTYATKQATKLHAALIAKGVGCELEHSDKYKHVDIAIPAAHLYIEVDGLHHLVKPKQIEKDLMRSYYSERDGFHTMHISNIVIEKYCEEVAEAIAEYVSQKISSRL